MLFRPKLDNEIQSIYEECLNSDVVKIEVDQILEDKNSFINKVSTNNSDLLNIYVLYVISQHTFNNWYIQQVYTYNPFHHEQIKIFEAKKIFYSLMYDSTKIISTACFVQFINQKSKEYFGYCIS